MTIRGDPARDGRGFQRVILKVYGTALDGEFAQSAGSLYRAPLQQAGRRWRSQNSTRDGSGAGGEKRGSFVSMNAFQSGLSQSLRPTMASRGAARR